MSKYTSDQQKQIDKLTKQYEGRGLKETGADRAKAAVDRQIREAEEKARRDAAKKK